MYFVSSVVTALPGPRYAVYAATKAALEGFARSLRAESRGRIRVQVVRPGPTRTGMHEKAGISPGEIGWERFPPAERVAAQLERALNSNATVRTLGLGNKLVSAAGRAFPGGVDWAARRRARIPGAVRAAEEGLRQRCLVTGAADGIGRALALRFAREGYDIVGVDVDPDKSASTLDALRALGAAATFIQEDLSEPEAVERIAEAVGTGSRLSLLVHNAGINAVGHFGALPIRDQEAVVAVNLQAPLLLTAGLLRADMLRSDARFIFMASLSCCVGYPGAAVYAASKDGLAAYARALSAALGPRRRVLTVYPGPVRTAHAERHSPDNSRAEHRMAPARLAALICDALARDRRILVPGWGNRAVAALARIWPAPFELLMRRAILDKLGSANMPARTRQ